MKLFFLAMLFSFQVMALPIGVEIDLDAKKVIPFSPALEYDFEGIVKLSNCSGSLVQIDTQTEENKAWVLTNGHCLGGGFLRAGEFVVNRPVARSMRLFDKKMRLFNIQSTRILFATMTGTDAAIYELNETYAQLRARTGVTPLRLAGTRAQEGINILVISGYWDRGYNCRLDGFVFRLKEGDWTFTDSIRYTPECNTIGGTSGSPIVQSGTRDVIGVNNTMNESGRSCTLNNPCEVSETGGVIVRRSIGYGQQTYHLKDCVKADFTFDLSLPSCTLKK
jgi:V8-like Glu-specific endopeptidase